MKKGYQLGYHCQKTYKKTDCNLSDVLKTVLDRIIIQVVMMWFWWGRLPQIKVTNVVTKTAKITIFLVVRLQTVYLYRDSSEDNPL
jgi:hypothetical protein